MITTVLNKQYINSLDILKKAIEKYDINLWNDDKDYKSPAWVIFYHALFYTNIYCSSLESTIIHWEKERKDYHRFDKIHEKRINNEDIENYSKEELIDFSDLISDSIPNYLKQFEAEKKCWPYWYDENQLEFQIKNLRHLQHHIGEAIERHDIIKTFEYQWK